MQSSSAAVEQVLLPNVRGSAGYGKAYLAADDGVKREQALQDITATLDFIGRQPDLDASRVGVYGGSYGGDMTLATAAFQGRRVRADWPRANLPAYAAPKSSGLEPRRRRP